MMTEKLARSAIQPKNPLLDVSRSANLPHVPGVRVGDYLFLSGMGPIDPRTGGRNHGPIAEQIRTTLNNIKHMLESAGSSLERVVRVHVVLADISHLVEMQLRFGNGCEIECVALVD
jgi:2-iminobutanoate/2-iminopropanoate deaminase